MMSDRRLQLTKATNTQLRKSMIESAIHKYNFEKRNPPKPNEIQYENIGGLRMQANTSRAMHSAKTNSNVRYQPYSHQPLHQNHNPQNFNTPQNYSQVTSQVDSDDPYPHIIGLRNAPENLSNQQLKSWWQPYNPVAIKPVPGYGYDIAFNTHKEACTAMAKEGDDFNGMTVSLDLKSKKVEVPKSENGFSRC